LLVGRWNLWLWELRGGRICGALLIGGWEEDGAMQHPQYLSLTTGAGCYADCASIGGVGGGGYEYPFLAVEKKFYNALSVIDH
jgi:hypothetical protein